MKRIAALLASVALVAGCMAQAEAVPTTVTATATATATAVATPSTVTSTVTTTLPPVTVTVTGTTPTTTTPPTTGLPAGSEYAALGDSYSSGEGANQIPGGPQDASLIVGPCRRSSKAAQVLMTTQYSWNLLNLACAGSTTAHVLNTFGWEQPQMNLVTANTKLVTMTIGGNDVQLLQLLVSCVLNTGLPDCTVGNNGTATSMIGTTDSAITALEPKIEAVINAIVTKAPTAKIRIAGYPWIIAPPGQSVGSCSTVSSAEQAMFDQRLTATNFAIRQGTIAVAAANPTKDIQYLDPQAAGSPFDVADNGCSTAATRYLNGATGDATNWHPNIYGQQKYKALYQASI